MPRLHLVTVAHQDFAHDPSLEMLYGLALGIHPHLARGNDRAGDLGPGHPQAAHSKKEKHNRKAGRNDVAAVCKTDVQIGRRGGLVLDLVVVFLGNFVSHRFI